MIAERRAPIAGRRTRALRLAPWAFALALACGGDAAPGAVGSLAPDYAAATLAGEPVTLEALRGDVVLLNLWATWCVPCRAEIPVLQALHESYGGRGLRLVGVTVDARGAAGDVRAFVDEFGMTYDVWHDPDQTAFSTFSAIGVPLTVLIDRDGRIVWRHEGPIRDDDPELLRSLEDAL